MFTSIAQNVVLGWVWRRVQEIVAWAFTLVPLYLALPPQHQDTIREVLSGQGGGLSISAVLGLAYYLFTQWQSFRATTVPQAVTTAGVKIVPKKGSEVEKQVNAVATGVKPASLRPTLWEQITGAFKRS